MSRLTRDGTNPSHETKLSVPCSAHHEKDWQLSTVDPYSAECAHHTHIHTYLLVVDGADMEDYGHNFTEYGHNFTEYGHNFTEYGHKFEAPKKVDPLLRVCIVYVDDDSDLSTVFYCFSYKFYSRHCNTTNTCRGSGGYSYNFLNVVIKLC